MKAFLLMSAAWLSGAGGDPTPVPLPVAAPVVSSAPTGSCCGGAAPVAGVPYTPAIQSTVVPGGIAGGCGCDPCSQAAPAATAAPAGTAPATSGPRHLFHRLFHKKSATASPVSSSAPAATAVTTSGCGCDAPVVGGSCGCGGTSVAYPTAAPAPAAPASGGLFSRFFGRKEAPAPAPAPVYVGTVSSGTPCCGSTGTPYVTGAPATAVIQGYPQHSPYPGVLPGSSLPTTGAPIIGSPVPGSPAPLPMGTTPEGIKEAPKEPMKLPGGEEKKLQPTSGTRIESEGRNPFDHHRRQQAQLGCAADYSSMTGRLQFVHVDGGLWVLRYAPLDRVDAHGGSVVLSTDRRLESYREGDIVTVNGTIIAGKATSRLAAPLYRFDTIVLVDRPTN